MLLRRSSVVTVTAAALGLAVLTYPAIGEAAAAATPTLLYNLDFAGPDALDSAPAAAPAEVAIDTRSLECMAKVVHHESRGQPRRGQLAVAQTLVNRLKAGGRFGNSICEVANQPGQFFNTRAYNPSRSSDDWETAVQVARETLAGEDEAEAAAPGAMFFHAAYHPRSGFFRSRQKVAAIGGQVFYR